jgi:hypothetical protein
MAEERLEMGVEVHILVGGICELVKSRTILNILIGKAYLHSVSFLFTKVFVWNHYSVV